MNIKKDDGYTPLHLASLNDHLDVVTALAELVSTIIVLYIIHIIIHTYVRSIIR